MPGVDPLLGPWRVVEVGERSVSLPLGGSEPELTFLPDGTLNGSTGVNRFRGAFVVADETLSVGPLVTTRMAGSPAAMEQETAMLTVLGASLGVVLTGNDVVLDDGKASTRLRRLPDSEST